MNMSTKCLSLTCLIGSLLFCLPSSAPEAAPASESDNSTEAESNPIPEEEKPFWDSAQTYVDAYAKRDSAAIGNLFTKDAEFFDEFGKRTLGRDAIVELFQNVFEESPETLVDEINIERVRYINETVALEEGEVVTTQYQGAPRTISRYIALHVKESDGVWRINTLKDYRQAKNSRREQLNQLEWMVGEWVSEDPTSLVYTQCDWSADGNYLLRKFTVKTPRRENIMNGVQRIGWDPVRREIRSWVFDSEGGVVEGVWKRSGDQWLVTSTGFTAEGETASGIAIYTIINNERVTWQHRNLVVGNELRENADPVVMVRRPPAVGSTK